MICSSDNSETSSLRATNVSPPLKSNRRSMSSVVAKPGSIARRRSLVGVSIHAPARGDVGLTVASRLASFDPRPREGGDASRADRCNCADLFRSTPPEGAHVAQRVARHDDGVSIHAPAKGRLDASANPCADDSVSIHAPAKEATDALRSLPLAITCFDPRPREGGDRRRGRRRRLMRWFRSTPPRRRRPPARQLPACVTMFRSTPP